jgi:enoyl-CoA hydratase/carnithine racemase
MAQFETYRNCFKYVRFRREDGIVEMAIHRDGGTALWDFGLNGIHRELGDAFAAVASDPDCAVLIFTGTGQAFLTDIDVGDVTPDELKGCAFWDRIYREGKTLLQNLLDIEVPVVAAVNGNAFLHAEIALLSDIVLAADHARFADKFHFPIGVVPGDGVHVLWPMLLGPNRARYFLLTGEELAAEEAKRLGVVGEVMSSAELMPRAWALARQIALKPVLTRRYARVALIQDIKRRLLADLSHGLMLEGMAWVAMQNASSP